MKKFIIFFSFVFIMFLQGYSKAYSDTKFDMGTFYVLLGNEGDEEAVMYLNVMYDGFLSGKYYNKTKIFNIRGWLRDDNIEINLNEFKYIHIKGGFYFSGDESTLTGTFDTNRVFLSGNHNFEKVNLHLAGLKLNKAKITKWSSKNDYIFSFYNGFTITALEISYLDNNIICGYDVINTGGVNNIYLLNDYRKINMEDIFDSSIYKYHEFYDNLFITPSKLISFYDKTSTVTGGKRDSREVTFTYEELKPYVKKGSPLEYLFN